MNEKRKNVVVTVLLAAIFLVLSLAAWFKPVTEYSDSERRVLAKFPELTLQTVLSGEFMTEFEDYSLDQFPLRDSFRSLKSAAEFYLFHKADNNGLYISDGYISKIEYPRSDAMMDNAAAKFKFIYDTYLQSANGVYFSVIPDKNAFMAENSGHLSLDYSSYISDMVGKVGFAEYIDITDLLSLEDFYRTDTHWRQESIVDVADRLTSAMGGEISGSYTENTLQNPFYGVYCGQIALPVKPDTIKYLTNDVINACTLTGYNTGKPMSVQMYDMDKAAGKDPYEMFTSGSDPIIVIENPGAETDRELVIFRDSFGSSIAPLMVESYAKVTLVDIRYIQSAMLGYFVNFENCDALFLYSTMLLNSSTSLK
ncbi:MAG: hypothetical protein IJP23_00175 [Oscillospiraceae bacterium]|nr:hypothetical protein [Oscillospiraceae bacterium]